MGLSGTAFFDLKIEKAKREVGRTASKKLRLGLLDIPSVELVDEGSSKTKRIITGTLKSFKKKKSRTLEKLEKDKYVVQVFRLDYYSITLHITETATGKRAKTIKEEMPIEGLEEGIRKILLKVKDYFDKTRSKDEWVIHKSMQQYTLSLSGNYILPQGNLANLVDYGMGFKLNFGILNTFLPLTLFEISGSAYYCNENNDLTDSFSFYEFALMAGYSIYLLKDLRIIPKLGAGYNLFIVKDSDGQINRYLDPLLTLRSDIGYRLYKSLEFLLSPGYTLFFEEDGTGRYMSLNTGVRLSI